MKPPFIKRLILKRFRSVEAASITFPNPTFLVGLNGAGKSNLVDAFSFLSEVVRTPIQAALDKRGGIEAVRYRPGLRAHPGHFGLGIVFCCPESDIQEGRYAFEIKALSNYGFEIVREQCHLTSVGRDIIWFERRQQSFDTNVSGIKPKLERDALALPLVGGVREFAPTLTQLSAMRVYAIEPGKLRELQDPDSGTSLRKDGGNITSVLQELRRKESSSYTRLRELLEKIVPGTVGVRAIKHGKQLTLKFEQKWGDTGKLAFEAFAMSDGTLRAVGLLGAILQKPTPTLLCIEEPEAVIHPGALGAILDLIQFGASQCQVIVTTHSPELLDAKWIEPEQVRMVSWEQGSTKVEALGPTAKSILKDHLMGIGEMMRSNVLDSEPLFDSTDLNQLSLFDERVT